MDSKWASHGRRRWCSRVVVHEHTYQVIVLLRDVFVLQHAEAEVLSNNVSFESLHQYHLPCPDHTAPPRITFLFGASYSKLDVVSVSEPGYGSEFFSELSIEED